MLNVHGLPYHSPLHTQGPGGSGRTLQRLLQRDRKSRLHDHAVKHVGKSLKSGVYFLNFTFIYNVAYGSYLFSLTTNP